MSESFHYYAEDVRYLIHRSPYLPLARQQSALPFLKDHVEAAEECHHALSAYPKLQIEALTFSYTCLLNLGTFNLQMLQDLVLRQGGWRAVVWGGWLALLEPHPDYAEPLRGIHGNYPDQEWLIECALAEIEGRPSPHPQFLLLVARLRRCLAAVERPRTRLRLAPSAEQCAQLQQEQAWLRQLYHREGADAVLRLLPHTLIGTYVQDYERWLRSSQGALQTCG